MFPGAGRPLRKRQGTFQNPRPVCHRHLPSYSILCKLFNKEIPTIPMEYLNHSYLNIAFLFKDSYLLCMSILVLYICLYLSMIYQYLKGRYQIVIIQVVNFTASLHHSTGHNIQLAPIYLTHSFTLNPTFTFHFQLVYSFSEVLA